MERKIILHEKKDDTCRSLRLSRTKHFGVTTTLTIRQRRKKCPVVPKPFVLHSLPHNYKLKQTWRVLTIMMVKVTCSISH